MFDVCKSIAAILYFFITRRRSNKETLTNTQCNMSFNIRFDVIYLLFVIVKAKQIRQRAFLGMYGLLT